jgi:hypothetical protein
MNLRKKKLNVNIYIICLLLIFSVIAYRITASNLEETECRVKLKCLYSALCTYYDEHGHLPEFDKWYDLLLEQGDLSSDVFLCPVFEKHNNSGSYTINKDHDFFWIESTPDTVLIFEGNAGWNQFGGIDQITEPHRGGSYVLFSNGDIKFVKKKDCSMLRWRKDSSEE